VWNTCLVFFQGVLLLGYLYAHLTTKLMSLRRQAVLHIVLLAAVILVLPIAVPRTDPPADAPALWLLGTLFAMVGLPFLALSTTSPLLQRWYAGTRARGAKDPYFLSVASNLGCLAALVAYPTMIEPALGLAEQSGLWRWGYVAYVGLVAVSAVALWQSAGEPGASATGAAGTGNRLPPVATPVADAPGSPTSASRLTWLILAFVPASLLTGVTQAITTDVAPMPLLWVVPLALYLLTFIVAFAPRVRLPFGVLGKVLAVGAVALTLTLLANATEPLWLVLPIHLLVFFLAALVCHGRLAVARPPADRLTSFYLWMSLGGVLGGAFNALLAPVLFHRLGFVEYPLMLLAACALRPVDPSRLRLRPADVIGPAILGAVAAGLILLARMELVADWLADVADTTALPTDMLVRAGCFGMPLLVAYLFVERPVRFALGLGALFLAGVVAPSPQGRPLHVERNFLGVLKVTVSADGEYTRLIHGSTIHGQQRNATRPGFVASFALPVGATNPLNAAAVLAAADGRWDDRHRPLTYYHPTGPAGVAFRYLADGWTAEGRTYRIGAVGLGTGALASYARPNQDWTFFELDPAVERLARDERYFTFLRDSHARSLNVVIGDARLRLAAEPDGSFDLLVLDAFSSDAIPIHLLTAEAFALYERKLAKGGVILLHLSNRYLDLPPVVTAVARGMPAPMAVRLYDEANVTDRAQADGKSPSVWAIVARRDEDCGELRRGICGFTPAYQSGRRWTDDRADQLRALRRNPE
jgi:hypothetical protein